MNGPDKPPRAGTPDALIVDPKVAYLDPAKRSMVQVLRELQPAYRRLRLWLRLSGAPPDLEDDIYLVSHLAVEQQWRLTAELLPGDPDRAFALWLAYVLGLSGEWLRRHGQDPDRLERFLAAFFFLHRGMPAGQARTLARATATLRLDADGADAARAGAAALARHLGRQQRGTNPSARR